MRSDNLQLPCVQPPTSSYNPQLPHGLHGQYGCHHHYGHHGHGGHGGNGEQNMVIMVVRTGKKLTFKFEFPGNLWLAAAFAILVMFQETFGNVSLYALLFMQFLFTYWSQNYSDKEQFFSPTGIKFPCIEKTNTTINNYKHTLTLPTL